MPIKVVAKKALASKSTRFSDEWTRNAAKKFTGLLAELLAAIQEPLVILIHKIRGFTLLVTENLPQLKGKMDWNFLAYFAGQKKEKKRRYGVTSLVMMDKGKGR